MGNIFAVVAFGAYWALLEKAVEQGTAAICATVMSRWRGGISSYARAIAIRVRGELEDVVKVILILAIVANIAFWYRVNRWRRRAESWRRFIEPWNAVSDEEQRLFNAWLEDDSDQRFWEPDVCTCGQSAVCSIHETQLGVSVTG